MPQAKNNGMWAVTAYFNPMRYTRRRENYTVFRRYLDIPLLAVELAHEDDFQLADADADLLIQLRGGDVLWQKERLLNLAMRALPPDCRRVVCLDCDIVFESADWLERTARQLDRSLLVQPFSHLRRMPRDWTPADGPAAPAGSLSSPAYLVAGGVPFDTCLGMPAEQVKCSTGTAWAAPRDLLQRYGFYDTCVIGGGDSAFVRAAYGRFDDAMRLQHMNAARRQHYMSWAQPFHAAVAADVSFVEGNLLHLWHGSPDDRRYRARLEKFEKYQFDPYVDVVTDDSGVWRWSSGKTDMHAYVRGYFAARREDG
jgi:hypothetical protein